MLRHLFTLIWNRKRANFLLITEIFFAFVILFVVGSTLVYNQQNYRTPLGFDYEQVWQVDLDPGMQPRAQRAATQRQIIQRLKSLPDVRFVARSSSNTPFSGSTNRSDLRRTKESGGAYVNGNFYYMEDAMRDVLAPHLIEGRWFDKRDDATTRQPIIITQETREKLFPKESPLGRIITSGDQEMQVVGVAGTYRASGDLSEPRAAAFLRVSPQDTSFEHLETLLVRVQPQAGAALEKRMTTDILAIGKGWSSNITPLAEQRAAQLKRIVTPLVALVVVCVFLIINVALGLFGVLWQTINQRRAEIGLRRAIGATGPAISGQIVGEILVVTTFGLLLGLLVAAQFPLLGVLGVKVSVYLTAIGLATALIYGLAAVCALYPSWLAAKIHPAVALREE